MCLVPCLRVGDRAGEVHVHEIKRDQIQWKDPDTLHYVLSTTLDTHRSWEYFEYDLFLIDTGKFCILNKSHNWTFVLRDFFFFTVFFARIFFLGIFPCMNFLEAFFSSPLHYFSKRRNHKPSANEGGHVCMKLPFHAVRKKISNKTTRNCHNCNNRDPAGLQFSFILINMGTVARYIVVFKLS